MTVAVDTNIFLDVLIPNPTHVETSLKKLESASRKARMIICEIVYTELASQFSSQSEVDGFLSETGVEVAWNDRKTLFEASRRWQQYRIQRKRRNFCPGCGVSVSPSCPQCGGSLSKPNRVLKDFIIGSHAAAFADVFLTRDRGFYRNSFSGIKFF
jgi:predicted nucleic acid-binding protein